MGGRPKARRPARTKQVLPREVLQHWGGGGTRSFASAHTKFAMACTPISSSVAATRPFIVSISAGGTATCRAGALPQR